MSSFGVILFSMTTNLQMTTNHFGDLSTFIIANKIIFFRIKSWKKENESNVITFLGFRIDDVVVLYCGLNVAI